MLDDMRRSPWRPLVALWRRKPPLPRKDVRLRPSLLFSLPLLLIGSAAVAAPKEEEPYRPSPPTIVATPFTLAIAAFDRNGDLKVSRNEYEWGVAKAFAGADRNGDETLSLIEFGGWAEATLGNAGALPGRFDFDRDGDDRISRAEFRRLFAARFATLDTNRDAALVRAELISLVDTPLPRGGRNERARQRVAPAPR
jgi:hypothetical protein